MLSCASLAPYLKTQQCMVNLSNHPSDTWTREQVGAAKALDRKNTIIDLQFPTVDPTHNNHQVYEKACNLALELAREYPKHVFHVKGDYTFVYALVGQLKLRALKVVAATTERTVGSEGKTIFKFIKFRSY